MMKIKMIETTTDLWVGRVRDMFAGVGILACVAVAGYAVDMLR